MLVCCIIFHELLFQNAEYFAPQTWKHWSSDEALIHGESLRNSWSAICGPRVLLFLLYSANSSCRGEEDASILGEEHGSCKKMMTNSCLSLVSGGLMCWFGGAASFLCALGFQLFTTCALFSVHPVLWEKERNNDLPLIVLWELFQIRAPLRAISCLFKAGRRACRIKDEPESQTCVSVVSSLKCPWIRSFNCLRVGDQKILGIKALFDID